MLYLLENMHELTNWDWTACFRLFRYVTFRAGGAAVTAFLLCVLLGPWMVEQLRRRRALAMDRYAGVLAPEFIDKRKNSTPSMGGILIVGAITFSALLWMNLSSPVSLALIVSTALMASIGFLDDYTKITRSPQGISARTKTVLIAAVAFLTMGFLFLQPELHEMLGQLYVPFRKNPVGNFGWWMIFFQVLVIWCAANGVNLTDGKDGLATGSVIFCALAFALIAYLSGHAVFAEYLMIPNVHDVSEAVVYLAAMIGACMGFLWHNCYPASVFMGDTGSLALGSAIGLCAVLVRQELLLIPAGIVFVLEEGSVFLQVLSFRLTGKRIFRCTPIHHHFEQLGWTETQIVSRFWIIAGLGALMAVATLKLR